MRCVCLPKAPDVPSTPARPIIIYDFSPYVVRRERQRLHQPTTAGSATSVVLEAGSVSSASQRICFENLQTLLPCVRTTSEYVHPYRNIMMDGENLIILPVRLSRCGVSGFELIIVLLSSNTMGRLKYGHSEFLKVGRVQSSIKFKERVNTSVACILTNAIEDPI
jgi:hypothetical protein